MSPIDERLKSIDIVLPDVMPPVVDGYVPAFAPLFAPVIKFMSPAASASRAVNSSAGTRATRLAWIKVSLPRATWPLNCWPCLKPASAILAAFEEL